MKKIRNNRRASVLPADMPMSPEEAAAKQRLRNSKKVLERDLDAETKVKLILELMNDGGAA